MDFDRSSPCHLFTVELWSVAMGTVDTWCVAVPRRTQLGGEGVHCGWSQDGTARHLS